MIRFFKPQRARKKPAPGAALEGWIERYLAEQALRSREADPETDERRRLLLLALERSAQVVAPTVRPKRRLWPKLAFSLAASGALVLAALVLLPHDDVLTYQTGRGRQTSVMLSDSTRISLNHTSVLRLRQTAPGAERLVHLEGEAFFQVERTGKPFVVETSVGTVRVLGTAFNVRARTGALEVTVVRGKVAVSSRDSTVTLKAGEIALCRAGERPSAPQASPFAEGPGWLEGYLLLYKTTVQEASEEIEERFDVTVHLVPQAVRAGTVTGKVESQSAEAAVRALALLTGNRYRRENDVFTIY